MTVHRPHPPAFSFDLFYTTVNAYYRSAAVKAAIDLGVFDVVGEDGKSLDEIATACGATHRGIRILCHFLVSIGFLMKRGELFFMTRDMAVFLDRKSPGFLGGSIDFLLSPYVMDSFRELSSVIRTGRISQGGDGIIAPDHPQWVRFARAMAPMMSLPSLLLAEVADLHPDRPTRILDVAAGHGLFGIAIAQRNRFAQITFVDWDNVLDVARENAAAAGVADRCVFLPGDAFDVDFGGGYDAVLMTNFLHHFDEAACETILRKAHAALEDGGVALIFEFIADEGRTSPALASTFSMMMLATTPAGEVYTFADMKRLCEAAGYSEVELRPIPPAMEKVIVAHRGHSQQTRRA
jgi:2-polyprenyl-3-methyl-5-hydroxy-6-metoxy-1,4-benzoquinol methylase